MGYEIPFDSRANGIGNGYAAARWHGASEADRVEPDMPKQRADETLCPADRRREVASILAKGLVALVAGDPTKAEALREFIRKQSGELNSALISLAREAGDKLGDLGAIVYSNPEWSTFGALLSITGSKLSEEQMSTLRNLPSWVYYGVNSDKAIALRLLGVPRAAAARLAGSMGDFISEPLTNVRSRLREMDEAAWRQALGEREGGIYREVWRVLEGIE